MPLNSGPSANSRRPAAKKPPLLTKKAQPVIKRLSQKIGEPVITYWNSTKGSICQNNVVGITGARSAGGLH